MTERDDNAEFLASNHPALLGDPVTHADTASPSGEAFPDAGEPNDAIDGADPDGRDEVLPAGTPADFVRPQDAPAPGDPDDDQPADALGRPACDNDGAIAGIDTPTPDELDDQGEDEPRTVPVGDGLARRELLPGEDADAPQLAPVEGQDDDDERELAPVETVDED